MLEQGESSRVRDGESREILVDTINDAYATISGYEMPPVLRDTTPDEEQGEFRDIQIDTTQLRVMEPHIEAEGSPRDDQLVV